MKLCELIQALPSELGLGALLCIPRTYAEYVWMH